MGKTVQVRMERKMHDEIKQRFGKEVKWPTFLKVMYNTSAVKVESMLRGRRVKRK